MSIHSFLHILRVYEKSSFKNITRQVYSIINNHKGNLSICIKKFWEKDLGGEVTEEEWNLASKNTYAYIKSPYWQEYAWKVLVRFFVTPLMINKYTHTIQSCWRECGEVNVDLVHILFTCVKIKPFWTNVNDYVKQICGEETQLDKHFMLGIPPKNLNKESHSIFGC